MTEHLPECALAEDSGKFTSWMIDECICDRLRACEARVKDDALTWARAREVNGVTWAMAWDETTEACVAAFHDRLSDSDLDDVMSDDEKDIVAQAIRKALLR
jgi:hypothetical protein